MKVNERSDMILRALQTKYEGEKQYHKANIEIYLSNPAGIGEHPDVLAAVDAEVEKMVAADEKINLLLSHWEF
tara:strand:+ start:245 stop:463 length:219 start_codon:yes stop_codon:yes gene_type:complete